MVKTAEPLPQGTLVPNHLVIIPDGNRRWARARGLPAWEGHRRGFDITPGLAKAARQMGIHTATIWAFSTENWDRSKEEIAFLMKKYEEFVDAHLKEAQKDGARIIHLGRKDRLPDNLVKKIVKAEEETKNNQKSILNVAIDYGGHDEILRATQKILEAGIKPEELTEAVYLSFLDTHDQPYPGADLIIRTSGEQRLSGILSWQSAYAELYFIPEHFPDFTPERLREAVIEYSHRRRRFGGNDLVPKVRFQPDKLAKLEIDWWQRCQNGHNETACFLAQQWIAEIFGVKKDTAGVLATSLDKALICCKQNQTGQAAKLVEEFYRDLKEVTGMVFEPETASSLELEWWKLRNSLNKGVYQWQLEKAFQNWFGEIYRLSNLQTYKIAHLRTLAVYQSDFAQHIGQQKDWQQARDYLTKSYQALKEAAS